MTYDLTQFNSTNARTILDLTSNVNTASGGIFGSLLLAMIFFFFLVSLNKAGFGFGLDNLIGSSFLTSVFGGLLFLLGLISWFMVLLPLGLMIILLIVKFMQ